MERLHLLESNFLNLRVCSVNVGTLRDKSEEIAEMLEGRLVDIFCKRLDVEEDLLELLTIC